MKKKIRHMWTGFESSLCGQTVDDADPKKHHFEEDHSQANCKDCFKAKLVDRFLCWPLPKSVCSDKCVTIRNYAHRVGTNLLTADEAGQMIEHLFEVLPLGTGTK